MRPTFLAWLTAAATIVPAAGVAEQVQRPGDAASPVLIQEVAPEWPPSWYGRVPPGKVELAVTVGTDGRVKDDIRLIRSDHPRLVEPVVEAVRKCRFSPATRAGVPVDAPIQFVAEYETDAWPLEMPPQLFKSVEPEYPAALLEQKLDGEVELEVRIAETGAVVGARVVRSDHPEFAKAAVAAIGKWSYEPALIAGKFAKSTAEVKMKFRWKKAAKSRGEGR